MWLAGRMLSSGLNTIVVTEVQSQWFEYNRYNLRSTAEKRFGRCALNWIGSNDCIEWSASRYLVTVGILGPYIA
jgi:hypothetical protein